MVVAVTTIIYGWGVRTDLFRVLTSSERTRTFGSKGFSSTEGASGGEGGEEGEDEWTRERERGTAEGWRKIVIKHQTLKKSAVEKGEQFVKKRDNRCGDVLPLSVCAPVVTVACSLVVAALPRLDIAGRGGWSGGRGVPKIGVPRGEENRDGGSGGRVGRSGEGDVLLSTARGVGEST
jgi:hypothetical protein